MNNRGASSVIGIILLLIVFMIVFVTGLAPIGNVASDTAATTITSGIPALFFQNLNLWIMVVFVLSILWMIFSG